MNASRPSQGFFLRLDEVGVSVAGTRHWMLEEAKVRAEFEYAVASDAWPTLA